MTLLPVVERELQVAARKPATYRLRFAAALMFLSIWLVAVLGGHGQAPAQVAREQFEILSGLATGCCLCAGIFLTADCLSAEKRDGTLGLLFLTDLRGHDVVLGKLAANSMQSAYALLSVLPMLALPLLMGGITVGEFWRMVLVLLAALLFSLAAGMAVSAICRETRQAMVGTVAVVILFTGIFPAMQAFLSLFPRSRHFAFLLWPSAGYTNSMSADRNYRLYPDEFWGSLGTIVAMALSFLAAASVILPQTWRERKETKRRQRREAGAWQRWRFGTGETRRLRRARSLSLNPFYWLAIRDRLARIGLRGLTVLMLPLWLAFFIASVAAPQGMRDRAFETCLFTVFGWQLILKLMIAAEASRRLSDDRESGALELMLVTPLSADQIVAGQMRALVEQFQEPLAVTMALYAALLWSVWSSRSPAGMRQDGLFTVMMLGNMVALVADFLALSWVGMWTGLKLRHHRAVLLTFAQVIIPAWLFYILMGTSGLFNGGQAGVAVGFGLWFLLGFAGDALWVWWARGRLEERFRNCVAGVIEKRRNAGIRFGAGEASQP